MGAAPPSLELQDLTWPEVARALDDGYRTVVLVGAALEGHGPHLPLGTDIYWGRELGLRVARQLGNALLAPVIPFGPDEALMAFPGTVHVDDETAGRILACACESFLAHGFERVVACTSHGGYFPPLAALRERLGARAERVVVVDDIFELLAAIHGVGVPAGMAIDEIGAHAGEFETSAFLAIEPSLVRMPLPAGTRLDLAEHPDLFDYDLSPIAPDGVVGDPRRSDSARGERYLQAVVDLVCAAAAKAEAGAAHP